MDDDHGWLLEGQTTHCELYQSAVPFAMIIVTQCNDLITS